MAEQIIISNKKLKVTISTCGAEIISVVKDGTERIWEGDPEFWTGHAPILFPICGGLKDDKFMYDGNEYTLQKHGYARFKEFAVESRTDDCAVFVLRSVEEDKKQFPFNYEFRITYSLNEEQLNVEFNVKNLTDGDMYFSVGAHEAYACPEGIEAYSVIFEKDENLDSHILNGNLLEHKTVNLGNNTNELLLKYEYFAVDALVFLNLKSKKAMLKNNITGSSVEVEFNGHNYFLLWTKPGAKYICLEPWCGIQDFVDSDYDITHKIGIIKLLQNETCIKKHSIVFN